MTDKVKTPRRILSKVPEKELIEAVTNLAKSLDIPGSTPNYDLYKANLDERQRAIEKEKVTNDYGNKPV